MKSCKPSSYNYPLWEAPVEGGRTKNLLKYLIVMIKSCDIPAAIIILSTSIILLLGEYIPFDWMTMFINPEYIAEREIIRSLSFSLKYFILFCIIPAIVMRALISCSIKNEVKEKSLFPGSLRDTGLGWRRQTEFLWIFAIIYIVFIPFIIWAACQESFQGTYPFFSYVKISIWHFLLWEALYGLHYIGIEYFFRGFLIFGLYPRFGNLSVFFATIPYVVIHFSKPWPETAGSIIAGIFLGYMALRSRSIWGGYLIHWAIGISMDVLSVIFSGGSAN